MFLSNPLKDRVFNRKLLSLAFPISMQNLMLALVAAADAVMLGKVSQNAMAAVSLATQIQFVQNMLLGAIVSGAGILGAQYWGKKDTATLGRIFGLSIHEAMLVSVAFFLGCRYFPEKLMLLFAHDPELVEIGAEYLKIASWSYLLTGVSQCYLAIMRVSEHASRSAWISSGAVIANIVLNSIFIFGLCGAPAMGVKGAALATVLYYQASQHMTAQTRAMIDKALALDSNEITALMLLASDAFMQANYAQAIELWQKVMDLNSPRINRTQLVESINMAKLLQRRSD